MPQLKRPQVGGPLKDLNDALHELHAQAGLPSIRHVQRDLGGAEVASRGRVHDAFTSARLPTWGLVQLLVEALSKAAPNSDPAREERRFHSLWLAASGAPVLPPAEAESRREIDTFTSAGDPHTVVAVRVEWEEPGLVEMSTRRWIRTVVDRALGDIGYPVAGPHRQDGSAGSLITLKSLRDSPSLAASTLLASVDDVMAAGPGPSARSGVRFFARLGTTRRRYPSGQEIVGDSTIADLDRLWSHPKLAISSGGRVTAFISGWSKRERDFPGAWEKVYLNESGSAPGRFVLMRRENDPWSSTMGHGDPPF